MDGLHTCSTQQHRRSIQSPQPQNQCHQFTTKNQHHHVKTSFYVFLCISPSVLFLPDLGTAARHHEPESEAQKPRCCPGSDPAAEREEFNYFMATQWEKQTHNRQISLTVISLQLSVRLHVISLQRRLTCCGRNPAGPGKRLVLGR